MDRRMRFRAACGDLFIRSLARPASLRSVVICLRSILFLRRIKGRRANFICLFRLGIVLVSALLANPFIMTEGGISAWSDLSSAALAHYRSRDEALHLRQEPRRSGRHAHPRVEGKNDPSPFSAARPFRARARPPRRSGARAGGSRLRPLRRPDGASARPIVRAALAPSSRR